MMRRMWTRQQQTHTSLPAAFALPAVPLRASSGGLGLLPQEEGLYLGEKGGADFT